MGDFHKILTLGIIILLSLVFLIHGKRQKEGFYGQAWSWNANTVWSDIMRSNDERGKYYYQVVVGSSDSQAPPSISGGISVPLGYSQGRIDGFRDIMDTIDPEGEVDNRRQITSQSEEWADAFMRRIRAEGMLKLGRFQLSYNLAKAFKNKPPNLTSDIFQIRDGDDAALIAKRDTAWTNWYNQLKTNSGSFIPRNEQISWWMYPSTPKFYDPEIGNIDWWRNTTGRSINDYSGTSGGDALGELPDEYLDALMSKWKLYETYKATTFYFNWDDESMYFFDLSSKQVKKLTKEEADKGMAQQPYEDVVVDTSDTTPAPPITAESVQESAQSTAQSTAISEGIGLATEASNYLKDIAKRKVPFLKAKRNLVKISKPTKPSPIQIAIGLMIDSLMAIGAESLNNQFPNLKGCNTGEYDLSTLPSWANDLISNIPMLGDVLGRVLNLLQPYLCIGRACPADKEMDTAGGLCYPRCRSGFKSNDITMCINNNNPLDFYDRGVGSPAIYFRWKEPDVSKYQQMNQQAQQRNNDLKAIRYVPNYSDGACVINAEDNATIMKAARLFISLTSSRQWITKINKAIVSSSRSIDFDAVLNSGANRVMRFYFTKDATGCSFTPRGLTLVSAGKTTWDFTTYDGKEINLTLDYGLSDACRTNNVGNTCSSSLVLNAALTEMPKAMEKGEWILSVDEVKDLSDTSCLYKANVDNFDPDTNRPIGRTKNIIQATVAREFDPTTCKVNITSVSDLGNETAMPATDTRRTGYRTLSPASTFAAKPPPTEKTLQGCSAKCSDSSIISRLVYQYNKESGGTSKIIRVKKASTPSPLSCDFLMDMVIRDAQGNTKMIETNRRMNLRKVGTTCDFDYISLESSDTGYFIQENSPEAAEKVSFSSAVQGFMKSTNDALTRYMDGVSSGNQTSDKNVRDTMTREQEAQKEEASARAIATARTAGGMKTLTQCSIAANSKTVLDIIEKMIREILRRDPLNARDFEFNTVAIRFDKWGYDNATNTVILDYNTTLPRRGNQFRNIAGFRFYTGLCSPPRIDKATIHIMAAGFQPGQWLAPGPANRYFVSPIGEIKNSPSTDTDTVNISSDGSQATNSFAPPAREPLLRIENARWGPKFIGSQAENNFFSSFSRSIRDDILARYNRGENSVALTRGNYGNIPPYESFRTYQTIIEYRKVANGPILKLQQDEGTTLNFSSLT